jgi:hypothetical protein
METNVLLRLIKDDIKLLNEINRSFIDDEKLSPDEVEVALTRARSLVMEFEMLSRNVAHEHQIILNAESTTKSVTEDNITSTVIESGLPELDTELIDLEEEVVSIQEIEQTVQKAIIEEPSVDGKLIREEMPEKASKPAKASKVLVQGELFEEAEQKDGKTVGEIFRDKHQTGHDFHSTDRRERSFEVPPLKSLRDGIGINDRYLFIKELFGDEPEKFDETIAALDGFKEIEEAVGYLKENFKWSKSEAGQKFLNLVKRRFRK